MAPSEDPRDQTAGLNLMGLDTDLEISSDGEPAHHQKAVPTAHLTFIIDCTRGKQLSLAAPSGLPRAPSPNLRPVAPLMKTYILFCGESQPHLTQEIPLGGEYLAQAGGTLPPYRGTVALGPSPSSTLGSQEAPEAKGGPLKTGPSRSSAWEAVIGSLKALSSCVCGQADY